MAIKVSIRKPPKPGGLTLQIQPISVSRAYNEVRDMDAPKI